MQPTPMNGRSEPEILARAGLRVMLGEAEYRLRPLTMSQAEKWENHIRDLVAVNFDKLAALDGFDAVLGFIHQSVELQVDILYSYDQLGAVAEGQPSGLPARSRLSTLASRHEIWDALNVIWRHEFPFVTATAGTVGSMLPDSLKAQILGAIMGMARSAPPSVPSSNSSSTSTPAIETRKRSARR